MDGAASALRHASEGDAGAHASSLI
eukprot:COSAG05_NODE_17636_length_322_cov_0.681614_1_plen_24_part_10